MAAGVRRRIEDFLRRSAGERRGELLVELIAVELQLRRSVGETVSMDEYQTRFAEHVEQVRRAFALADDHSHQDSDRSRFETPSLAGADSGVTAELPIHRQSHLLGPEQSPECPTSTDDSKTPVRLGRYRIERVLEDGGFGRVYLAHDDELNRLVAIKTPHSRIVSCAEDAELYRIEALRARERVADEQLSVQQMGPDLQGRDDDGRRDRSSGSPQRDHRTERTQLPSRNRQENDITSTTAARIRIRDREF